MWIIRVEATVGIQSETLNWEKAASCAVSGYGLLALPKSPPLAAPPFRQFPTVRSPAPIARSIAETQVNLWASTQSFRSQTTVLKRILELHAGKFE